MKLCIRTLTISALLLVFSFANAVVAKAGIGYCGEVDGDCFSQLYVGVTGGEAGWNLASDSPANFTAVDENATYFGALFGYRFNKFVGFELVGNYFGEPDYIGINPLDVKVYDYGVGMNFYLPLGRVIDDANLDFISVFAKVGMHYWYLDLKDKVSGYKADDDGADLYYGFGINFDMNKHLALRAEHNVYQLEVATDDTSIDTNSLTFIFKF
jgi:hypothetical protein